MTPWAKYLQVTLGVLSPGNKSAAMIQVPPFTGTDNAPTPLAYSPVTLKNSDADTGRDCFIVMLSNPFRQLAHHAAFPIFSANVRGSTSIMADTISRTLRLLSSNSAFPMARTLGLLAVNL